SFCRLPRGDLDRSAGTDVQLAQDHVVQLLVVDHPDEDIGRDHAARAAVVQDLLTVRPIAVFLEGLPHGVRPLTGERRAIDEPFSLSVSMTESTHSLSPCRTVTDVSRRFCGVRKSVSSSRKRGGLVFPIKTSPPWTRTSGEMSPSSGARFAYDRSARAPRTSGDGISKWSSWPPG